MLKKPNKSIPIKVIIDNYKDFVDTINAGVQNDLTLFHKDNGYKLYKDCKTGIYNGSVLVKNGYILTSKTGGYSIVLPEKTEIELVKQ